MKHHPLHSVFLAVTAALLTAGCASFRKTQADAFIDGNGNILQVQYGVRTKPYTYKMVSPMNGKEFEGRDTKMVRLMTPAGEKSLSRPMMRVSARPSSPMAARP